MANKVLIVDDHELFREGLVSLFNSQPDYRVVGQAGSVREAVETARTFQPDMILMDFGLPDGTGADATGQILSFLPNCKIVFLTVYETDEQLMAGIRAGAKGYLLKNIPFNKLFTALRSLERDEPVISRRLIGRLFNEIAKTEPSEKYHERGLDKLSRREIDILKEISSGATNEEIAQALVLSINTVKHHIHNLLEKLELTNRREAAIYAKKHGLVKD